MQHETVPMPTEDERASALLSLYLAGVLIGMRFPAADTLPKNTLRAALGARQVEQLERSYGRGSVAELEALGDRLPEELGRAVLRLLLVR